MVTGAYHTRQVIVAYDVVAQLTWNYICMEFDLSRVWRCEDGI